MLLVNSIPPCSGGAEHVAWDHAKSMAIRGHQVHVLTFGEKTKSYRDQGVYVHLLKRKKHSYRYYLTIGSDIVTQVYNRIKPDIIHSHVPGAFGYILRKKPCKKILTMHSGTESSKISDYGPEAKVKQVLRLYMWRQIIRNCNAVTATSRWHLDYCINEYRVIPELIPNGVDLNKFYKNKDTEKLESTVLNFGRLIKRKGVDKLLEAAKDLTEYNFWFTGQGNLEGDVCGNNINLLDFKVNLNKVINKSTICVFPSVWENLPLVGLEAMACGTPIIATQTGFSEYVKDGYNGILIENNNPETIKTAVIKLMEDKQLRDKISNRAIKTAKDYDWSKVVIKYEKLYERLLENN